MVPSNSKRDWKIIQIQGYMGADATYGVVRFAGTLPHLVAQNLKELSNGAT